MPLMMLTSLPAAPIVFEALLLTFLVVASLTAYTFYAVRQGADFSFLGPILWVSLLVLLGWGFLQVSRSYHISRSLLTLSVSFCVALFLFLFLGPRLWVSLLVLLGWGFLQVSTFRLLPRSVSFFFPFLVAAFAHRMGLPSSKSVCSTFFLAFAESSSSGRRPTLCFGDHSLGIRWGKYAFSYPHLLEWEC